MMTRGTYCKPFSSLRKNFFAAFLVPATLDQDVQHIAILVHGSPQIMLFAIDLDEHLIEVPFVTGSRTLAAQFVSVDLTELETPFTNRFVAECHTTHRHDFLHVTKAQSEAEVERATRSLETALRLWIRDLDQL